MDTGHNLVTTTYPLRYSLPTMSKHGQAIYQSHRAMSDDLWVSPSRVSLQMLPASSESSGHPRSHPRQRGLTNGQGTGTSINPSDGPLKFQFVYLSKSRYYMCLYVCVCERSGLSSGSNPALLSNLRESLWTSIENLTTEPCGKIDP